MCSQSHLIRFLAKSLRTSAALPVAPSAPEPSVNCVHLVVADVGRTPVQDAPLLLLLLPAVTAAPSFGVAMGSVRHLLQLRAVTTRDRRNVVRGGRYSRLLRMF